MPTEENSAIEKERKQNKAPEEKLPDGSGVRPNVENDGEEEYEEEDDSEKDFAKTIFKITLVFLIGFIVIFVYNLIKCYSKLPSGDNNTNTQHYSRELQNTMSYNDDSVLDLSN